MLTTPLGQIKVYADDAALDYEAVVHIFDRGPVKGHPIAARGMPQIRPWISEKELLRW